MILDKQTYEHDLKDFSFTFIELPKLDKDIDHLSNMIEKWAYFLKNAEEVSEEALNKLTSRDPIIQRAFKELNSFHWSEAELLSYNQAEKHTHVYHNTLRYAREEGKEEGLREGKRQAALSLARAMLENGMSMEDVCRITKLSKDELYHS